LSFLASDEALLLVHREMPYITRTRRYDLMLTPQFYVSKKESLPVSYAYQAAKLAPSILDELTGTGTYRYAAIKEDDGWALIAYDMTKIEAFLAEKGLPKSLISRIYFAQQSKTSFKNPVSVDEKNAIVTVDDTVVMLPKSIVDVEEFGILTNAFRPDNGISPVQSGNALLTQKQAILFSLLLLCLAAGYMFEGLRYQKAITAIDKKVERTKSRYPQLEGKSTMVLNNLYASNYAIDSLQRKIRDRLKDISRLTSKVSKIDRLKIDTKQYEVHIQTEKAAMEALKKYARSRHLKVLDAKSGLTLKGAL